MNTSATQIKSWNSLAVSAGLLCKAVMIIGID